MHTFHQSPWPEPGRRELRSSGREEKQIFAFSIYLLCISQQIIHGITAKCSFKPPSTLSLSLLFNPRASILDSKNG